MTKPTGLHPEALAAFIVEPDAAEWIAALIHVRGPMRTVLLQHAQAMAQPENQMLRLLNGPLLSETITGRVIERRARGEWPFNIATAEGLELQEVYDILKEGKRQVAEDRRAAIARAPSQPKPTKAAKKPKRPPVPGQRSLFEVPADERPAIKADIVRRYLAGESNIAIAEALKLSAQSVDSIIYAARKAGDVPPIKR